MIITKVEIAKNVTIIFLDNASLIVRLEIVNILFHINFYSLISDLINSIFK